MAGTAEVAGGEGTGRSFDVEKLKELLARMETAGPDPDMALAGAACKIFFNQPDYPTISGLLVRALGVGSIDAAFALIAEAAPFPLVIDLVYVPKTDGGEAGAAVRLQGAWAAKAPTVPLALVSALLVALITLLERNKANGG